MGGYGQQGSFSQQGGYGQQEWGQQPQQGMMGTQTSQTGRGYGGMQASWGQSELSRSRKGPKNYARSDERIREMVCERLVEEPGIDVSEVSINVKNGCVELEGTVPSRQMRHRIEDVVDECWGVQDIENRIRVQSESQSQSWSQQSQSGQRGQESQKASGSEQSQSGSSSGGFSGMSGSSSSKSGSSESSRGKNKED